MKRWKTIEWPAVLERKHASQAATYRHVVKVRADWLAGRSRTNKIVVWVSEDKGPWQRYENLNLNDEWAQQ